MTKIIYIAGYGRSGSTILDSLLNNHPSMIGTGELSKFFEEQVHGNLCSCGATYSTCPFWQNVILQLQARLPQLSNDIFNKVTLKAESLLSLPIFREKSDLLFYRQIWSSTITAISEASEKNIIIDSSKNGRRCTYRIRALRELKSVDVSVIHLVRDPRAVMWSILRGSNRKLKSGQPAKISGGAYRALASWSLVNLSVHVIASTSPYLPIIRLRYEDVIRNPVRMLQKLGSFLEIDMVPVIEILENQIPLKVGHGVAGNRIRSQGSLRLQMDQEWQNSLPYYAKQLCVLSWPLVHKYGYDIFS